MFRDFGMLLSKLLIASFKVVFFYSIKKARSRSVIIVKNKFWFITRKFDLIQYFGSITKS